MADDQTSDADAVVETPAETGLLHLRPPEKLRILRLALIPTFLAALDQTVVTTAMPGIVNELHGMALYGQVFTAFMVTSTIALPIAGRLGDLYGRDRLMWVALGLFMLGSLGCGLAPTMPLLVVARALQGLGGGAIHATVSGLTGDLFSPLERGRYVGQVTAIFGLSSLLGPVLGGLLADQVGWRWIFLLNVPLGLAALTQLMRHMPKLGRKAGAGSLDVRGIGLMSLACVCLLLGLAPEGREGAIKAATGTAGASSPMSLTAWALVLVGLVCVAGLVRVASRVANPILPLPMLGRPAFRGVLVLSLMVGGALFLGSTWLPLFCQRVFGWSATQAGALMVPQTLAVVAGSIVSGRYCSRKGRYKPPVQVGILLAGLSLLALSTVSARTPLWLLVPMVMGMGLGVGTAFVPLSLGAQNAVPTAELGVASGFNSFCRTLGGALSVGLGGVLLHGLEARSEGSLEQHLPILFGVASGMMAVALVRSLWLQEVPLRATASHE